MRAIFYEVATFPFPRGIRFISARSVPYGGMFRVCLTTFRTDHSTWKKQDSFVKSFFEGRTWYTRRILEDPWGTLHKTLIYQDLFFFLKDEQLVCRRIDHSLSMLDTCFICRSSRKNTKLQSHDQTWVQHQQDCPEVEILTLSYSWPFIWVVDARAVNSNEKLIVILL
jgi:hypothetical protein